MDPQLIATTGRDDLALVYLLQFGEDAALTVETVDSIDPRFARSEKSVIILSTQFGCPVGCTMCDAGSDFRGNLSAAQMLAQIRWVVSRRPEVMQSAKLKIHFARMGEPALNEGVLEALSQLPRLFEELSGKSMPDACPGLLPCIASVAPIGRRAFFEKLMEIKRALYTGRFQLQLSLNSTDETARRKLMPIAQLPLDELSDIGERFFEPGDRKVVLNFALSKGIPVDADKLAKWFNPERFMIKLTPLNPTEQAEQSGLASVLSPAAPEAAEALVARFEQLGFDTIVSIGEPEEIAIGSNCGQLARSRRAQPQPIVVTKATTSALTLRA
jgi:23S rRNA (adenine2503-C2)-methyltransferase